MNHLPVGEGRSSSFLPSVMEGNSQNPYERTLRTTYLNKWERLPPVSGFLPYSLRIPRSKSSVRLIRPFIAPRRWGETVWNCLGTVERKRVTGPIDRLVALSLFQECKHSFLQHLLSIGRKFTFAWRMSFPLHYQHSQRMMF